MSNTRSIYQCLEHVTCNVTNRGKEVLKFGLYGTMLGAVSGATLGGISVGFHDMVLRNQAASNFIRDHENEYPKDCHLDGKVTHCTTNPDLDRAANNYGTQYAQEKIAEQGPPIAIWCTVGGAALGLFSGLAYGWMKTLPVTAIADIEQDVELQRNYQQMPR